jgi:hypothetical protein
MYPMMPGHAAAMEGAITTSSVMMSFLTAVLAPAHWSCIYLNP